MQDFSQKTYQQAILLLQQASTPQGFLASINPIHNYKRIWTRDGVVIGLASLCSENESLIHTFQQHLISIFEHQHPTGFLPSNIDIEQNKQSYGGSVGRTDNGSWGIIGLCLYALYTGEKNILQSYRHAVEKIFNVMDVWEFNGKHLIYMPQSGNWADEYLGHGYILSEQLLRIFALRLASRCYENTRWNDQADIITQTIEVNFWNKPQQNQQLYFQTLEAKLDGSPQGYWLMGFNPSGYYTQCDLLANALSLILNIGNASQQQSVIDHFHKISLQSPSVFSCFLPIIDDGEKAMQELKNLYAYEFRNLPGEFHNGGLWTVWNSFFVWALQQHGKTDFAQKLTERLHQANALNNWDFNECLKAQTQEAIGVRRCSWSAAGSIIAEKNTLLTQLLTP